MTDPASNTDGYTSQRDFPDDKHPLNAMAFVFSMLLGEVCTAQLVQVLSVTNAGETAIDGRVSVQVMVNQIDTGNTTVPHGEIFNVPYFRLRGGKNAVIIDPEINDIGVCVFAMRDISAVKSTKKISNPGSQARFSYADALYIGGFLNGIPEQFFKLKPGNAGIDIVSPTKITLTAPIVEISASDHVTVTTPVATVDGETRGTAEITAKYGGASVTVSEHNHTQGNDSHGDSEVPTNAPTPGT